MRLATSAHMRAVGLLLLEAACLGMIVAQRLAKDPALRGVLLRFLRKVRAL